MPRPAPDLSSSSWACPRTAEKGWEQCRLQQEEVWQHCWRPRGSTALSFVGLNSGPGGIIRQWLPQPSSWVLAGNQTIFPSDYSSYEGRDTKTFKPGALLIMNVLPVNVNSSLTLQPPPRSQTTDMHTGDFCGHEHQREGEAALCV